MSAAASVQLGDEAAERGLTSWCEDPAKSTVEEFTKFLQNEGKVQLEMDYRRFKELEDKCEKLLLGRAGGCRRRHGRLNAENAESTGALICTGCCAERGEEEQCCLDGYAAHCTRQQTHAS